jgi:hypothetical protein
MATSPALQRDSPPESRLARVLQALLPPLEGGPGYRRGHNEIGNGNPAPRAIVCDSVGTVIAWVLPISGLRAGPGLRMTPLKYSGDRQNHAPLPIIPVMLADCRHSSRSTPSQARPGTAYTVRSLPPSPPCPQSNRPDERLLAAELRVSQIVDTYRKPGGIFQGQSLRS